MSTRRIVTTHDAEGKSKVWLDAAAENVKEPNQWIKSTLLWSTAECPADYATEEDFGNRILGTAPPANGSRFIMFEVAPGGKGKQHKSDTLDYVVGIEGELVMTLDNGVEVTFGQGDVIIQRGTFHGWVNKSDKPAKIAIVLLDGAPKRDDSIKGNTTAG